MQIIKNIQVEIRNIHIRYEDKTTDQSSPFSIGATISTLTLQSMTTDPFTVQYENPRKSIEFIYKVRYKQTYIYYFVKQCSMIRFSSSLI